MNSRTFIKSALVGLTLVGAATVAQAGDFKPGQAKSIDLGDVGGIAYYTADDRGYHVVVTLSPVGAEQTVRFEATLASGQSVTLSAPRGLGTSARSIALTRKGDHVVVTAERVASNN